MHNIHWMVGRVWGQIGGGCFYIYLFGVIVRVRVVFRKTVVGD